MHWSTRLPLTALLRGIRPAEALAEAGGRLVVTPSTRPALVDHAASPGLPVAAGHATASEAFDALDAGAQALGLFPATTYGPGHVKAPKAVLPPVPHRCATAPLPDRPVSGRLTLSGAERAEQGLRLPPEAAPVVGSKATT